MCTTPEIGVRELDRRSNDGIEVALLWHPRTNHVSIAVADDRHGESFEVEIDPANALHAFQHPYVYAAHDWDDYALAS